MNQDYMRKTVKKIKELQEFIRNHTPMYTRKHTHTSRHPEIPGIDC